MDESPVQPEKLSALIQQADRIVVSDNSREGAKVLFISTNPKDIAEFNEALNVVAPEGWFHCMCSGTPAVRLYRGDTELALVTNHHGQSIRCSLWTSDAMLQDTEKWVRWYDARHIPGPRKEAEDLAASRRQDEVSYARWKAAMPKSIAPIWEKAMADGGEISPDLKPLRTALAKDFPDTRHRILALFAWHGSGAGPWSGYPGYETAAEELLLEISTRNLVAAAQTDGLTEAQLEGAARLFGGWDFSQRHPEDRKKLSAALKKKLLDHSLKSTDKDKRRWAQEAFGE